MNKFMMALVGVAVCIPAVVSANSPDPQYVKLGQYSQDLHMAPSLDSDQISVLAANTENIYNFGCLINGDDNVTFDNENSSSAPLNKTQDGRPLLFWKLARKQHRASMEICLQG
jgi:hypothetical protein